MSDDLLDHSSNLYKLVRICIIGKSPAEKADSVTLCPDEWAALYSEVFALKGDGVFKFAQYPTHFKWFDCAVRYHKLAPRLGP